jgi:nucleoid DNA-binding protein
MVAAAGVEPPKLLFKERGTGLQQADAPSRNKSSQAVEHPIEVTKGTLASGEDVLISGFGMF